MDYLSEEKYLYLQGEALTCFCEPHTQEDLKIAYSLGFKTAISLLLKTYPTEQVLTDFLLKAIHDLPRSLTV